MNYRVLAPLGFTNGRGEGMSCTTVGAVVEVDESEAKALVAAGKLEVVPVSKEGLTETEVEADRIAAEARAEKAAKPRPKPES